MSSARELKHLFFHQLDEGYLEEELGSFHQNLKNYNNLIRTRQEHLINEVKKLKQGYPDLPREFLRNQYIEFYLKQDLVHQKKLLEPKLPRRVIEFIFMPYLDITDLCRFSITCRTYYRKVRSVNYFKIRLKWEAEHFLWIIQKIRNGLYDQLIYQSNDQFEACYKNQVVLKRHLAIIDPFSGGPNNVHHKFIGYDARATFIHFFRMKYKEQVSNQKMVNFAIKAFETLTEEEISKYEHAGAVADRYGFFFCFRPLDWKLTQNQIYGVSTDIFCEEKDYLKIIDQDSLKSDLIYQELNRPITNRTILEPRTYYDNSTMAEKAENEKQKELNRFSFLVDDQTYEDSQPDSNPNSNEDQESTSEQQSSTSEQQSSTSEQQSLTKRQSSKSSRSSSSQTDSSSQEESSTVKAKSLSFRDRIRATTRITKSEPIEDLSQLEATCHRGNSFKEEIEVDVDSEIDRQIAEINLIADIYESS